jgi:2-dehydro-3-deoxyphosphogalactonate aldolase
MPDINLGNGNAIMAIIRGVPPEDAVAVAKTMYEAGVRIIEVPLNSPEPFNSIASIVDEMGDQMLVGAGTVLDVQSVQGVKEAGGKFIVSPNTDSKVIQATKQSDMLSYPGVMTVTECIQAIDAGADGLKLFPASALGMEFIRAVKVILPKKVPIIVVGGINEETILGWRDAGADGFGLGSMLYKPNMSREEVLTSAQAIISKLSG